MCVVIKTRKFSKREVRNWRYAGFKVLKKCANEIILEIPQNWKIISAKDESDIKQFIDSNGNIRGAYTESYSYLCGRFDIMMIALKESEKENAIPGETERLCIFDKKKHEYICDMGTFEPYSDYESDLRCIAVMWLELKYPEWKNPSAYWED